MTSTKELNTETTKELESPEERANRIAGLKETYYMTMLAMEYARVIADVVSNQLRIAGEGLPTEEERRAMFPVMMKEGHTTEEIVKALAEVNA